MCQLPWTQSSVFFSPNACCMRSTWLAFTNTYCMRDETKECSLHLTHLFLPQPCEAHFKTDLEKKANNWSHHTYGNSTFALYIQLHAKHFLFSVAVCLQNNEISDVQEEWQWDFGGNQNYSHPPSCKHVPALHVELRLSTTPCNLKPREACSESVGYGAVGDGQTWRQKAFRKAWATVCASSKTGTMLIPKEKTYLLEEITFRGQCKSRVTSKLIWWQNSWRIGKHLKWTESSTALLVYKCNHLRVENVRLLNSQQMHMFFLKQGRKLITSFTGQKKTTTRNRLG